MTKRRPGRPPSGKPMKAATSFRLSIEAHALIAALADDTGLSQASVVEMALRDLAKRRGVKPLEGVSQKDGVK